MKRWHSWVHRIQLKNIVSWNITDPSHSNMIFKRQWLIIFEQDTVTCIYVQYNLRLNCWARMVWMVLEKGYIIGLTQLGGMAYYSLIYYYYTYIHYSFVRRWRPTIEFKLRKGESGYISPLYLRPTSTSHQPQDIYQVLLLHVYYQQAKTTFSIVEFEQCFQANAWTHYNEALKHFHAWPLFTKNIGDALISG